MSLNSFYNCTLVTFRPNYLNLFVALVSLNASVVLVERRGFTLLEWLWPVNLVQPLIYIRLLTQVVLIQKLVFHLLVQVASLANIWRSGMGLPAHIVR